MAMKTREKIDKETLDYIREHKGASIFWITDTQYRAASVTRLEETGKIIRQKDNKYDLYPWCVFTINEELI
jgi:hypothetical protein